MRLDSSILALPASILALIALHTTSALSAEEDQSPKQWPYNLPPHVKYWPEDPPNRRRDLEAVEEHLRMGRSPVGVMKMSTDEGEKFYMEYWQFEGEIGQTGILRAPSSSLRRRDQGEEARLLANASAELLFRPPFMLHTEDSNAWSYEDLKARRALEARNAAEALAMLEKRGFTCPTGTADCSSIGYPNSCCATSETCFAITDTGLGPVGCCPTGTTCGGTITTCNAPNTACADNLGGGCCIPNYVCAGVGCVINSSMVVTTIITQTVTITASSSTQTSTIVITTTSTSSSSLSTSSTCTSSYQSCPASLGGGCCPTDRVCVSGASCAPISTTTTSTISTSTTGTSTATGVPPVRPTSDSSTSTFSDSSATGASCPTGFYACEAYYAGGCCRTGRNCQTTSCPPISSTTIISGSVTVVVPVGSAATVTSPTGTCATGWSTCAPSDGGNCCPSGWSCGTASCSSVAATTTALLQKESPGLAVSNKGVGGQMAALAAFVVGVMLL
ncbi:hypothetical protein BDZ45DRAFT_798207 [Acephala macrosclerotiorum]|nr:hypothetical protein BDZ45DRAFT_798207 [Acephala macrosclerotiorum]